MKNVFLTVVVLSVCLLGGYLSPLNGITIFSILTFILVLTYRNTIEFRRDTLVAIAFSVWAIFSPLWAQDKWGAVLFSASLLSGSLFYVVLRNTDKWKKGLLYALVLCGTIHGFFGLFQVIELMPKGLFYNPNPYSGFLTPLVFISIYLYWKYKGSLFLWVTAFLIFSNLLSASRAGILSMSLAMLLTLYFLWKRNERKILLNLMIVSFLGFITYLVFPYILNLFHATPQNSFSPVAETIGKGSKSIIQKYYQHQITFRLFLDAPLLGHGMNSYEGLMRMVTNPYVTDLQIHSHNIFLNILVELGLVGLLIFLVFLFIMLRGPFFSSTIFFKIALLAFLFHNLVEYNFPAPPFQTMFFLLSALIMEEKDNEVSVIRLKGWAKRIPIYFLSFYFLFVYISPICGFFCFNRATKEIDGKNYEKAYKYLLYSTYCGYSVSGFYEGLASFLNQIYFSYGLKNEETLQTIEKNYLKALSLNKTNGDLYFEIARFYNKTGRPDMAEKYLIEAVRLFPFNQTYKYETARFYSNIGRNDEAIHILLGIDGFYRKYAVLDPLRIKVFLELAENYKTKGDLKLQDDYAGRAERLKRILTDTAK